MWKDIEHYGPNRKQVISEKGLNIEIMVPIESKTMIEFHSVEKCHERMKYKFKLKIMSMIDE